MLRLLHCLGLVLSLSSCAGTLSPRALSESRAAVQRLDWQSPSAAAVAQAKTQHKLVLLSVQAEFCHWCHVMNDTTYRDPRVVQLLRDRFVTLRIDQAADPALSARYADYGWPATAVLDANGEPVLALRGHQPAARFLALLTKLVSDFDAGRLLGSAQAEVASADPALAEVELRALARMDARFDPAQAGWGSPQKYPFAAPVEYALYRAYVHGEPSRTQQALSTLDGHAQLIDPVAGGMFQYSLGGVWSEPHFEKLAEIQAGALRNFAEAYRASGDVRFLRSAERVASYVLNALRTPDGSFMASQHADAGQLGQAGYMSGALYYQKSASERSSSPAPAFDRHIYADLNGMLIRGLTELWRASGDAQLLAAAETAAARIDHSQRRGDAYVHQADVQGSTRFLSDQVEMSAALSALADATGDESYRQRAYATLDFVQRELHDAQHGGFYARTAEAGGSSVFGGRNKPLHENARLARLFVARARREGEPKFVELALQTLRCQAGAIGEAGRKAGDALLALREALGKYVMFSVVGPAGDPRTEALRKAAYTAYAPHALLRVDAPGQGHYPYPGEPAVYLCSDSACSAPVSTPAALPESLRAFVRAAREP